MNPMTLISSTNIGLKTPVKWEKVSKPSIVEGAQMWCI
jgi:hypothetical protein